MTIERDCDLAQREFFLDWDWRVGKQAGVPRHFLGPGHPIPIFQPLPKPKPKDGG